MKKHCKINTEKNNLNENHDPIESKILITANQTSELNIVIKKMSHEETNNYDKTHPRISKSKDIKPSDIIRMRNYTPINTRSRTIKMTQDTSQIIEEVDSSIRKMKDETSENNDLNKTDNIMWTLFNYIQDYKESNESLIDPFIKLPSKRFYRDYYKEIKNPISLNLIRKKLTESSYKSFENLVYDLELMFENAIQYNQEGSLINEHARKLLNELKVRAKELDPDKIPESSISSPPDYIPSSTSMSSYNETIKQNTPSSIRTMRNIDKAVQKFKQQNRIELPENISRTPEDLMALGLSYSGGKIRRKREKKTGYNIFSKEFRKQLRDTKSSLPFLDMCKEVGFRWRTLTHEERALYEEKARLITIQEARERDELIKANHPDPIITSSINNILTTTENQIFNNQSYQDSGSNIIVASNKINIDNQNQLNSNQTICEESHTLINTNLVDQIDTSQTVNEQSLGLSLQTPILQFENQLLKPDFSYFQPDIKKSSKENQHKEAYMKYISNLRRQENYHNNSNNQAITSQPDWYLNLDINDMRLKIQDENGTISNSSSWISNVSSDNTAETLMSLRYYLLNDAINLNPNVMDKVIEDAESSSQYFSL